MITESGCDLTLPCEHYIDPWMFGIAGKCSLDKFNYCVNEFDTKMVSLSHSCKELFVSCRYAFYLRYILGINMKDEVLGEPLIAGRAWDEYVGAFHLSKRAADWPGYMTDKVKAKLKALIKVHRELITPDGGHGYVPQHWIKLVIEGVQVAGAVDRAYDDHFVETKLSGRPEFYFKPHNMTSQLGTYFLSNPNWSYCIMEVTRMPGMYMKNEETFQDYYKKVYQDIVKRPSYYFPGLKKDKGTFGIRIDRSDINLDRVEREYKMIINEIRTCIQSSAYYHEYASCHSPFDCSYLPICTTDTISHVIYNTGGKRTS